MSDPIAVVICKNHGAVNTAVAKAFWKAFLASKK
jgi:hypothetical protein